jgi:osmoprotectant transport system ATP-binding protein
MIRLERVTKVFPGAASPAVAELSIEIAAGEVVCLVGPSGCGKTTTLRMVNRLVEPTSGRIVVAGRDITSVAPHELRRGMGYVIQQVGLFGHRTIADNIATVPHLLAWDRARTDARVTELMDLVGLGADLAGRYPGELSGGQQQRVGVARALAADPPVLLMDEPFGAVDPIVRARLQDELLGLQERLRKTIVFVTHDIDEAIKLGNRVVVMNVGGIVEQVATPTELLGAPASTFVAEFVGSQRGLRRLSLIGLREIELDEPGRVDGRPTVPAHATLLDALQAIVSGAADAADVVDDDGRYVGTVSLDRIGRQLR